jgi:hypothetical protein
MPFIITAHCLPQHKQVAQCNRCGLSPLDDNAAIHCLRTCANAVCGSRDEVGLVLQASKVERCLKPRKPPLSVLAQQAPQFRGHAGNKGLRGLVAQADPKAAQVHSEEQWR